MNENNEYESAGEATHDDDGCAFGCGVVVVILFVLFVLYFCSSPGT